MPIAGAGFEPATSGLWARRAATALPRTNTGSSPVCTSSLRGWLSGYLSGRTAASWLISTILPDACPAALPVNMAWLMRGYAIPANRPPGCYTLAAEKGSGLRHLAFWPNCILSRTFRIIRTILGDIHFL